MSALNFRGVAHPPPARGARKNKADLSAAEIGVTNLGKNGGTDLLREHDHAERVGTVLSSWEGRDGSLRVSGVVTDADAITSIKSGETRGLSLGTSVLTNDTGERLVVAHDELSICETPARAGCYVTDIDGKQVREVACFSKSGAALKHKCYRIS